MKVFFDSNVIIDALSSRLGSEDCERRLLYGAMVGSFAGVISAKQLTDIYYVLRKYIQSDTKRRELLSILMQGLEIFPIDSKLLERSLASEIPDFEDAVILECACASGADVIVTNDMKGFIGSSMKVLPPQELSSLLGI